MISSSRKFFSEGHDARGNHYVIEKSSVTFYCKVNGEPLINSRSYSAVLKAMKDYSRN